MAKTIQEFIVGLMLLIAALAGAGVLAEHAHAAEAAGKPFLLHLNGIGGKLMCDNALIGGLKAGGLDAEVHYYDWTGSDKGLEALQAYDRNRQEAKKVAAILTQRFREHPNAAIYITAHSGGAGLAAWALEDLPDDVRVEAVLMLAPALSPQYDLTRALRHIRRGLYVFSSPYDTFMLSTGTKLFGTIDGVHSEAAGLNGFVRPAAADENEYNKLVPQPYQKEWLRLYRHMGSHVCPMRTNFAREYLAPVLLKGQPPATKPPRTLAVTTQPVGGVLP